jgi:diacylglycerol O-acyltransferase / wax synthase
MAARRRRRTVATMPEHQTMSAADAAWLHMDRPTNLMVINSVLWFDEPLDWEATQAVFLDRIVERFPRFRQRVDEGLPGQAPAWREDDAFEPRLHFHRRALPAPGDQAVLQEVVSDMIGRPLDRARPMWDVYLLEGFGGGCALLVRMHHAIADGIALARVLLSITESTAEPAAFTESQAAARGPAGPALAALHAGRVAVAAGLDTIEHPRRLGEVVQTLADDGRALAKFLVPGSDTASPLRGDLAVGHRVAWSQPVSLATVKRAGRAMDATVNDVLVAAVAGSIGEHLRDRGEPVDELHALVPFNLRPLDEPLPRELGNRFGLLLLGLPVGVVDPLDRVRAVQASMAAIKRSHEGAIAYGILSAIGHTPQRLERLLVDFFSAKGTMVLTNVPGPRSTVTLAGTPVAGVLVWAPCSGSVGMSVSVFSYAGKVTVGFLVDDALVDDPQQLADGFRRDLLRTARHARAAVPA